MNKATDIPLYKILTYQKFPVNKENMVKYIEESYPEYGQHPSRILEGTNSNVGVEIEVENIRNPVTSKLPYNLYQRKEDGSLRNHGKELITYPTHSTQISQVLHMVETDLYRTNPNPDFSERTSVHVHVDAREMSIEEIINNLFTYIVVERLLYRYVKKVSGKERANNIFCTPINKANYIRVLGQYLPRILLHLKDQDIYRLDQDYRELVTAWQKYLGINLLRSIDQRCGTIEYRHFAGTANTEIISTWIALLLKIKEFSKRISLTELLTLIQELNTNSAYEALLVTIFQELYPILYSSNCRKHMEESVMFVKACVSYQEAERFKEGLNNTSIEIFKNSAMYKALVRNGLHFIKVPATKKKTSPDNKILKNYAERVQQRNEEIQNIREVWARLGVEEDV